MHYRSDVHVRLCALHACQRPSLLSVTFDMLTTPGILHTDTDKGCCELVAASFYASWRANLDHDGSVTP